VDLPDAVTAVTAGHYHTLALTEAGEELLNAMRGLTAGLAVRVMCERDPRSRLRGSQSPPAFSTTQITRCLFHKAKTAHCPYVQASSGRGDAMRLVSPAPWHACCHVQCLLHAVGCCGHAGFNSCAHACRATWHRRQE